MKEARVSKLLPREMAESVAKAVEIAIATRFRGKSERVIAAALGVTQPALNKIRHVDGGLGINALISLRESLQTSIDDLLGLPPLATRALSPDELEAIRAILRAEVPASDLAKKRKP